LGLAVCGVVLAAAKPGAGPYHLIPLVPVVLYAVAYQLRDVPLSGVTDSTVSMAGVAFVMVALSIGIAQQAQFVSTMAERAARNEREDIERFVQEHRGIVEMGYGSTETASFVRPILVFRNNAYLLDQPAIREHQLAGLPFPTATISALRECRVTYWLIPKGEQPFSGRNAYDAVLLAPLFPDEFRRVFHETHTVTASTRHYDAWRCNSSSTR
jgi:hypothetical protein